MPDEVQNGRIKSNLYACMRARACVRSRAFASTCTRACANKCVLTRLRVHARSHARSRTHIH
eukprot:5778669-Pleurochrysis_carterae.AAC.1